MQGRKASISLSSANGGRLSRAEDRAIALGDTGLIDFPLGNSRMAEAILAKDWTGSPMGPIADWPDALKTSLRLILDSKFPHFLAWGEQLIGFFNDACAPFVEDRISALGRPFPEVWVEAWQTIGPLARAAFSGSASYFEDLPLSLVRAGQRERSWWTMGFSPVRLSDGEIGGVLCTLTETTRHVLLKRQLEESEAALRRFNDLVPELLWEADAAGGITYMNQRMIAFTGLAPDEMTEDWTGLVHSDDVAGIVAAYAAAQEKKCSFESQHRLRHADGSYRWFLARANPEYDDSGAIVSWHGCATDVHDWRLAVEQLRSSEEVFRRFAENATRILWVADMESGRTELLNHAGRQFWRDRTDGRIDSWNDWFRVLHPDDRMMATDALERLRDGERFVGAFRLLDGQGSAHPMRATLFPIMEPDGRITKFGGIAEVVECKQRRLVHFVDPDRAGHRHLSARLWANGLEVRGFTDVLAFAKIAPALMPGCVLIRAIDHPSWALRAVAAVRQHQSRLRTIVLSDQHRNVDHVLELMKLGASDVLPHDIGWEGLSAAIDQALRALEDGDVSDGENAQSARERISRLSEREREILTRLGSGATNKVVALELGISFRTVEAHRARILEKLEVSTLAEAITLSVRNASK